MNARWLAATAAAMVLSAGPALAQKVPENASEVARPGGTIAGGQKVALVKVADGFNDPVGVSVANDGSGRIFVVERVGRVKVVTRTARCNAEPFLDLTKTNPLGTDVQTGFVEQGLWSIAFHPKFKENGYFFVHYASLPFNGASIVVRFTVDPRQPGRRSRTEQTNEDRQGDHEHPAALLQPLRRPDRLRPRRQALHRQGRRRLGGRSARRRPAARHASRQDAAHRRRHARRRRLRGARRTTRSRKPTSRS